MADDLSVGSGLPREHWEHQLPHHLVMRSRNKGERMWTPTQFAKEFVTKAEFDDGGFMLLIVERIEDNVPGTIRRDPSGWHYAWAPDYSGSEHDE
jgi:hypothetical protein